MWKEYLTLSRNEQRGFLILIGLILLLISIRIALPILYRSDTSLIVVSDNIPLKVISHEKSYVADLVADFEAEYFVFDPNKIELYDIQRMGVDRRTALNWLRYLERGGVFNEPNDLSRIYGMNEEQLSALLPFIRISRDELGVENDIINPETNLNRMFDLNRVSTDFLAEIGWSTQMIDTFSVFQSDYWFPIRYEHSSLLIWNLDSLTLIKSDLVAKQRPFNFSEDIKISINLSDTAEWQLLRGIGPVLSRRIVAYRQALGGFVDVEQVAEVYGISPVLFKEIKPHLLLDTIIVNPIKINTASVRRLRQHPYLDFYHAKEIVDNRQVNGVFRQIGDVQNLPTLSELPWERLNYYFCLEADNE